MQINPFFLEAQLSIRRTLTREGSKRENSLLLMQLLSKLLLPHRVEETRNTVSIHHLWLHA